VAQPPLATTRSKALPIEKKHSVGLPAVAAITATAVIPATVATATTPAPVAATATTTATATATTTATTISTAAAPATATAAALGLGLGFVDHKVASTEVLPIEGIDGLFGVFITGNFDERETTRLAGKTIADQGHG
jgi:hypothetical protein